jgi:hypothetical protein
VPASAVDFRSSSAREGTASLSSSNHLPPIEGIRLVIPVALPSGREMLATSPPATGSPTPKDDWNGPRLLLHRPRYRSGTDDNHFATMVERQVGGVLVNGLASLLARNGLIVALATRHGLPTIYNVREGPWSKG